MEKKSIKVPLLVVLLVVAAIIILVLGAWVYILDGKVKDAKAMQDAKVVEYGVSNDIENKVENKTKEKKEKYVIDSTDENITYEDFLKKDKDTLGLYVTEAIQNNDGTFTLRGVGVVEYSFDKKTLENYFEVDGPVTLFGEKYIVEKPEDNEENVIYQLKVDENAEPLYLIVKEKDSYKLLRMAQIDQVYSFSTNYYEVTVPEDMEIVVGNEFSGESSTVEEHFKKYKTIKLQLTEEELATKMLDKELSDTYTFEIEDNEITSITQDLLGV